MRSWLSLPLLFLGSAAGVAASLVLMLDQHPTLVRDVVLSAPLLFGVAATLALLSGSNVRWAARWQRRWLRFTYPAALFGVALGTDFLHVPAPLALMSGIVATTLLVAFLIRSFRHSPRCSAA